MGPEVMAGVGMAASLAGSGTEAFGKLMGGSSESSMYAYKAAQARLNQQIAKQNADYERRVGEVEAQKSGIKTREEVGAQKAGQGASGLDVNSGSPQKVRESQQEVGQQDEAIIRSNAARRAYMYEVEGAKDESEASIYDMASKKSRTASYLGAAGSIIGGVSSVASKWSTYKTNFGSNPTSPGPYEPPIGEG